MGLFSSTGQPHKRCALRWTAAGGRGEGVEWRGREWSGGEGRGGQGRVPDCLGGLSRVGISSRSTRPWNGQPPSFPYSKVMCFCLKWVLCPNLLYTMNVERQLLDRHREMPSVDNMWHQNDNDVYRVVSNLMDFLGVF